MKRLPRPRRRCDVMAAKSDDVPFFVGWLVRWSVHPPPLNENWAPRHDWMIVSVMCSFALFVPSSLFGRMFYVSGRLASSKACIRMIVSVGVWSSTLLDGRLSPGYGKTGRMAGTGQGGRFSLSGRYSAIGDGIE